MDRDRRWERTDRALDAVVSHVGAPAEDVVAALNANYAHGVTDEFLQPIVLPGPGLVLGDSAIFFNFRPDRARQLTDRLVERDIDLVTMTRYRDDIDCPAAFPEHDVVETLAEVLAERGLRQLHLAETEKYAHVTYFLNGGREAEWAGEVRVLVPSPKDVATYDAKPEMSADEVAARFAAEVGGGSYRFAVVNFANPDMVGHTGVIKAVVRAVETVDGCLERVVAAVEAAGGVCLVCADHGNAEQMLAADGVSPHTAHTTNPVPLIVTAEGVGLRGDGSLADLAPTCLDLLGVAAPPEMTGTTLVIG
jgi:2,3-bisphosphoglycerate-independent phosphoglycerate mutase